MWPLRANMDVKTWYRRGRGREKEGEGGKEGSTMYRHIKVKYMQFVNMNAWPDH